MFSKMRKDAKAALKEKKMTYGQLSAVTGLSESTIKRFMCGADDSRRVAEKIADVLNQRLVYGQGVYSLESEGNT